MMLIKRFFAVLLLTCFGMSLGAITPGVADAEPAHATCPHDECDRWFFWDRCKDNPNGNTFCQMRGSRCLTGSCFESCKPE